MNSTIPFQDGKLEKWNHKINGTISEALKTYMSKGVPSRQLLSDYLDIISYPEELKEASNPWRELNSRIKKRHVVCGVSVNETLFNLAAMSLEKQKPIDVIKSVYYKSALRDDYALEKYYVNSIHMVVPAETKIATVNSSPVMIESFSNYYPFSENVVIDDTIAGLYSKQYKRARFASIEAGLSGKNTEVIIMNLLNLSFDEMREIIANVSLYSFGEVYAVVPTALVDNKESLLWELIIKGNYYITNILIIPKELSHSTPKKKCFVVLKQQSGNSITVINKLNFNKEMNSVHIDEKQVFLKKEDFVCNQTILSLWNNGVETIQVEKTEGTKKKALLYEFSKEIMLSYSLYQNDKGVIGKAYYAETKNHLMPSLRGKRLTKRFERGLHCKTEDEIGPALEKLAYNEEISKAIVNDISNIYLKNDEAVSLKTLWFCLRESLIKDTSYDDEYSKDLFSKNKVISYMFPQNDSIAKIQGAVRDGLNEGEEQEELKRLKLINTIVEHAIDEGYLSENRLSSLITRTQKRASKRQSEVRNALSKKSFEKDEEKRIFKFVYPLAKKDSLWLGVLIRLITGVSLSELCGICWRDYEYLPLLDIYRLKITKFINTEGKIISHAIKNDWEKYRIIPIPKSLGILIEKKKESLLKEGILSDALLDYPIISERKNISSIKRGHRPIYCKPSMLAKRCKEAVSQSNINQRFIVLPEEGNEIITDINSYNGDIFRTNFRNKAINVAGFETDELAYYLGVNKPDTFSKHYCDYTNDYVQLQMARKIERWAREYFQSDRKKDENTNLVINGIGDGVACVELSISNYSKQKVELLLEVLSEYGFVVEVSRNEKREL